MDLEALANRLRARVGEGSRDSLTQPERAFLAAFELEAEVNNGGFDQYFFNQSGDHVQDAIDGLEAMGAEATARIVRDAVQRFGPHDPPSDWLARQDALLALTDGDDEVDFDDLDRRFYAYEDNLAERMAAYWEASRSAR